MITLVDGPLGKDDWGCYVWETGEIYFDQSGGKRMLTMADVIFTHGKYKGYKLSEVDNTWYLKFIMEKNPDDALISVMFGRRLKELE